jgi:hypothetical protein
VRKSEWENVENAGVSEEVSEEESEGVSEGVRERKVQVCLYSLRGVLDQLQRYYCPFSIQYRIVYNY